MKGGYKIIDFKNVSLSGTPVTMTDVLVDLLNNYDKVVLLSHVVLSGSAKDDCFSTVLSDGEGGVKLNCYDGYISINSSGAVTYTVASASDTNNMIATEWSATNEYAKNSIVRSENSLYISLSEVPAGTSTDNTTYWTPYKLSTGDTLVRNALLDAPTITSNSELADFLSSIPVGAMAFAYFSNEYMASLFTNIGVTSVALIHKRIASQHDVIMFANSTPYIYKGRFKSNELTWTSNSLVYFMGTEYSPTP